MVPGTNPARLDELVPLGARVPDQPHLEGDAYLVLVSADDVAAIAATELVAAVEPLPLRFKLERDRFPASGEVAVVIDLFAGADSASVTRVIESWGGRIEAAPTDTLRAQIPAERLDELAARPDVRWIEPAS